MVVIAVGADIGGARFAHIDRAHYAKLSEQFQGAIDRGSPQRRMDRFRLFQNFVGVEMLSPLFDHLQHSQPWGGNLIPRRAQACDHISDGYMLMGMIVMVHFLVSYIMEPIVGAGLAGPLPTFAHSL